MVWHEINSIDNLNNFNVIKNYAYGIGTRKQKIVRKKNMEKT